MPNWVNQSLTITGPVEERKRFLEECFSQGEEGLELDFNKLIPEPEHVERSLAAPGICNAGNCRSGDFQIGGAVQSNEPAGANVVPASKKDPYRDFPVWYEWRCKHWGTKWNACDTQLTITGNGSKVIKLHFDTAWSIPWPIYEELAASFPLLKIEGEIFEPNMEFGDHIRCHGGKIEYEDKSEQIQANMAEFREKLERREIATTEDNLTDGDGDNVPF